MRCPAPACLWDSLVERPGEGPVAPVEQVAVLVGVGHRGDKDHIDGGHVAAGHRVNELLNCRDLIESQIPITQNGQKVNNKKAKLNFCFC